MDGGHEEPKSDSWGKNSLTFHWLSYNNIDLMFFMVSWFFHNFWVETDVGNDEIRCIYITDCILTPDRYIYVPF